MLEHYCMKCGRIQAMCICEQGLRGEIDSLREQLVEAQRERDATLDWSCKLEGAIKDILDVTQNSYTIEQPRIILQQIRCIINGVS